MLLTGHTGFKGSWLLLWLQQLGAQVWGYALPLEAEPNLFDHLIKGDLQVAAGSIARPIWLISNS